jgi:uncharacterized protein (DUF305 family)
MAHQHPQQDQHQHYYHLGIMTALSFIAMYILMYAMVNSLGEVFNNVNQVYMAGLMAAPMVLIELVVMRSMYPDRRKSIIIAAISVVALVGFFLMIRQQVAVTDRQFLRSMIPHHSSAILMCRKAPITSPEIRELCRTIISGQEKEISQMKALLNR